jgi:pimeloyl-ACP methyl ester carboxylesterase
MGRIVLVATALIALGCGDGAGGAGSSDDAAPDGVTDVRIDADVPDGSDKDVPGDAIEALCEIDADSPPDGSPDAGPETVTWSACPLLPDQAASPMAECATVEVPLRADDPTGRQLPIWLMRLPAAAPVRAQMWLLQGGPGASGLAWGPLMQRLSALEPGLELITVDHRGVGLSARLGCPEQEAEGSEQGANIVDAEWPACLAAVTALWGDDLAAFTSEAAARDVLALASRLRREGVPVFVYGASYGTTWGHRLLQVASADDAIAGVVLDAPNWPDRTYDDYDVLWSDAGRGLFEACANDEVCNAHLGPDPVARVEALWPKLDGGHCSVLGSTTRDLKAMLAWMLAYEVIRPFAPAIAYRLDRCNDADVQAIVSFYYAMFGTEGLLRFTADPRFSQVLSSHILYSEFAAFDQLGDEVLDSLATDCFLCIGAGAAPQKAARTWPVYPFAEELRSWADTATPVLFLTGELDPFAPAARLLQAGVREAFTAPGQHVVVLPGSAHGALDHAAPADGSASCGESILLGFLADPLAPPDATCLEATAAPSFTLPASTISFVLGTDDLWGDGPTE